MLEPSLAILIVSFAMFVRGFTGFGGALLTVPLLGLIWDVQQAIVVVAIMQVATGGTLALLARRSVARHELARVLVPSLVGLGVGAVLLSELPVEWVALALGVFSIGAGLNILARARVVAEPIQASLVVTGGTGIVAGLLQGMVGTGGPVIVPYMQRVVPRVAALRSTLLTYFLVLDALRLTGYIPLGIAGQDTFATSLYLLPFAVGASLLGGRLHIEVSDAVFQVAVAALLVLAGVLLLV